MVRSMVAAVAGLRTHQAKMDVIGNNIANVNTWGFKSSSFNFIDSMYATSINSSGGDTTAGAAGGRNPSQVGYGVTTGSISNVYTTGAPSPSSDPLDCMIDGTGFFLVGGMVNGSLTEVEDSGLYLSRVGIFRVDNNGYLVDDQRNYVYGYTLVDGTGVPEKPAQKAKYAVTGAGAEFGADYISIAGIQIKTTSNVEKDQINEWISAVAGKDKVTTYNGTEIDNPFADYNISYNNHQGPATGETMGTVNLTVEKRATGIDDGTIMDEFAGTTNNNVTSEVETVVEGRERTAGVDAEYAAELSTLRIPVDPDTGLQYEIQSYKINEDGTIVGIDSQNRAISIGQIALITVENPNGLEKTDGYYYSIGANCGDVAHQTANGGPAGSILGGYLEMANVDLANEFSNMITAQRGFQANSKMITVTDEMLQELVNMKR